MINRSICEENPTLDLTGVPEGSASSYFLYYQDVLERDQAVFALFKKARNDSFERICVCDPPYRDGIADGNTDSPGFLEVKTILSGSSQNPGAAVLEWIQQAKDSSLSKGYAGLSLFLEMGCVCRGATENWSEKFFTALDELTGDGKLMLLSAFNCRSVPPAVMLAALPAHSMFIEGGQIYPNDYHRPSRSSKKGASRLIGGLLKLLRGFGKKPAQPYRRGRVFEAILKVAPIGMWMLDRNHRIVFVNQDFSQFTGLSMDDMLQSRHYSEFLEPDERVRCRLSDARAFAADGPIQCEEELTSAEGVRHTFQIVKSKVVNDSNEVTGLLGLAIDISDRKAAETGLKEALAFAEDARDKIDNIIESIADGLIVTDTRNRIVLINGKARELLAINAMELKGESIGRAVRDISLLDQVNAIYGQDAAEALQTTFQAEGPDPKAGRLLQARTTLMRNNEMTVTGAITVLRDVTREQELDRIKAEFLSVAAHELRTPLTSILGYLEFCLHPEEFGGFSDQQQREFLVEINDKAELLARLVSDLLDIGRLEAGKPLPLDFKFIDIERLIGKIVEQYKLQAPHHRFEIHCDGNPCKMVRADENKLGQVLENLLSNAVKYSPKGSLVRVSGTCVENAYQVCVEDQGIGMTPEQAARIFDKFYRADFSDTAARGLGLGMSIVRQIVLSHNGSIRVESEKDFGTKVQFTVPVLYEEEKGRARIRN
ncbi:MAG: ATP-binding protein [Syntrophotaleaceae bacterium]